MRHAARVGSRDRAALPVGEITAITVETQTGPAVGARRDLGRQIYGAAITEVTIGAHRVQKFPGFPGPYGSSAFYYLVPLHDGSALELTGHRVFLEGPRGDTGYAIHVAPDPARNTRHGRGRGSTYPRH